jgi:hypothetical protein
MTNTRESDVFLTVRGMPIMRNCSVSRHHNKNEPSLVRLFANPKGLQMFMDLV